MILIDTGPLVAFFDASDDYHQLCLETLKGIHEALVSTWAVMTEAFYLLGFSWKAQDNLWEFIIRGGIDMLTLDRASFTRCRVLMEKYRDLPMDFADGTIMAIAEHQKIETVFTLDHRDFSIYQPDHVKHFRIIPTQP